MTIEELRIEAEKHPKHPISWYMFQVRQLTLQELLTDGPEDREYKFLGLPLEKRFWSFQRGFNIANRDWRKLINNKIKDE